MSVTLYSIGHSNRSIEQLLALLHERRYSSAGRCAQSAGSQRHPQFESEALREDLEQAGLQYHWAGRSLGGLRSRARIHRTSPWPMMACAVMPITWAQRFFKKGAAQLINLASQSATAVLCAERRPEQCHRQLLADYLLLQGVAVVHLIEPGERREHQLSAQVRRNRRGSCIDQLVPAGRLDIWSGGTCMFGKSLTLPTPGGTLPGRAEKMPVPERHYVNGHRLTPPFPAEMQQALLGMGCFWGAERKFWQLPGVYSTAVGYAGGYTPNPTYREVCSGLTGHNEVVRVVFDPQHRAAFMPGSIMSCDHALWKRIWAVWR